MTIKQAASDICMVGETCYFGDWIYLDNGTAATSANCNLTIYYPNGTSYYNNATNQTSNYYYKSFTGLTVKGVYPTTLTCTQSGESATIDLRYDVIQDTATTNVYNSGVSRGSREITNVYNYYGENSSVNKLFSGAGIIPKNFFWGIDVLFMERIGAHFNKPKVVYDAGLILERQSEVYKCISLKDDECVFKSVSQMKVNIDRFKVDYDSALSSGDAVDLSEFFNKISINVEDVNELVSTSSGDLKTYLQDNLELLRGIQNN